MAAEPAVDTSDDTLTDWFLPVRRCVDEPSRTRGAADGVRDDRTGSAAVPGRGTLDTAGRRAPVGGRRRSTMSRTSCHDCFRYREDA